MAGCICECGVLLCGWPSPWIFSWLSLEHGCNGELVIQINLFQKPTNKIISYTDTMIKNVGKLKQGIWSGMITGVGLQTLILTGITLSTNWSKEVVFSPF